MRPSLLVRLYKVYILFNHYALSNVRNKLPSKQYFTSSEEITRLRSLPARLIFLPSSSALAISSFFLLHQAPLLLPQLSAKCHKNTENLKMIEYHWDFFRKECKPWSLLHFVWRIQNVCKIWKTLQWVHIIFYIYMQGDNHMFNDLSSFSLVKTVCKSHVQLTYWPAWLIIKL